MYEMLTKQLVDLMFCNLIEIKFHMGLFPQVL
jgi:hypothetical protein